MDKFLFRVSTMKSDVWSNRDPKPVYIVASSKDRASELVSGSLHDGLKVRKVSLLAKQLSASVFSGA
jgi:hypothetical protein